MKNIDEINEKAMKLKVAFFTKERCNKFQELMKDENERNIQDYFRSRSVRYLYRNAMEIIGERPLEVFSTSEFKTSEYLLIHLLAAVDYHFVLAEKLPDLEKDNNEKKISLLKKVYKGPNVVVQTQLNDNIM